MAYTNYEQAILDTHPTLYWPLSDTVGSSTCIDLGPNNLVGQVGSAVTLGSTGLVGSDARTSVLFPGGANGATKLITSTTTALLTPNYATIEFIFKELASPGNYDVIGFSTSSANSLNITLNGGNIQAQLNKAGAYVLASGLTVGTTYHCVVTYDGAVLRLYINGAIVGSVATVGVMNNYGATFFCLGENYLPRTYSPNILAQDVAVYAGSVLSPQTIANHYAIFQGGSYTPTIAASSTYYNAVIADTPVGFWPLDDPISATTITDLSGNNISGIWQSGLTRGVTGLVASNPSDKATFYPAGNYNSNKVLTMTTGPISLLQPTTSFSCDFLINVSTLPSGNNILVGNVNAGDSVAPYLISVNSTGQISALLNNATTGATTAANTIVVNTTYHVSITYNQTNLLVYVNGIQVATFASTAAISGYTGVPFSLGDPYTSRVGEASYTIGQVAFYSQALTPNRVLAHYNATKSLTQTYTVNMTTDNFSYTDILNKQKTTLKVLTDNTIIPIYSVSSIKSVHSILSDVETFIDVPMEITGIKNAVLTDAFSPLDILSKGFNSAFSQLTQFTDAVSHLSTIVRAPNDLFVFTDSKLYNALYSRNLSHATTFSDVINISKSAALFLLTDFLGFVDSLVTNVILGGVLQTETDSFTFADEIVNNIAAMRTLVDSDYFDESILTSQVSYNREVNDLIEYVDLIIFHIYQNLGFLKLNIPIAVTGILNIPIAIHDE